MRKSNILFTIVLLVLIKLIFATIAYSQVNEKFLRSKRAIPNRYIVVLNDNNNGKIENFSTLAVENEKVRTATRDLSLVYGGRVNRIYSNVVKGYSAEMTLEQAIALSQDG